jgi:hypothetical protein
MLMKTSFSNNFAPVKSENVEFCLLSGNEGRTDFYGNQYVKSDFLKRFSYWLTHLYVLGRWYGLLQIALCTCVLFPLNTNL